MFYCNDCAFVCNWPKTAARWRGHCEMCGRFSEDMSDLPSSVLPRPLTIPKRDDSPSAAGEQQK